MIVTVFRSYLRAGIEEKMESIGAQMYELASNMPGFVSYKDFIAGDNEIVTIVEFETIEDLNNWRDHPDHRIAQQAGKNEFFFSYHIQVCSTIRDYTFNYNEVN